MPARTTTGRHWPRSTDDAPEAQHQLSGGWLELNFAVPGGQVFSVEAAAE